MSSEQWLKTVDFIQDAYKAGSSSNLAAGLEKLAATPIGRSGLEGLDFLATGAVLSNTWAANSSIGTKRMVIDLVPSANPGLADTLRGVNA